MCNVLFPPPSSIRFFLTANLKTAFIITIVVCLDRMMKGVCRQWWQSRPQGKELIRFVENVGRVLVLVAAVIFLMITWHINFAPLLASAGVAGLVIALAAKDLLANFFGGIIVRRK